MEIINSSIFKIAILAGRYQYPSHSLTLIVKGAFDLKPSQNAIIAKNQYTPTGDEFYEDDEEMHGGARYSTDFAFFKPRADLLLVGKCHAPEGAKVTGRHVTFQVGAQSKTLNVFGNRYWKRGLLGSAATDPEPFTEMDLRYENSFGGSNYKKNPVGKGIDRITAQPRQKVLPNIVSHDEILSPDSRPEPAGFGPIGRRWHQRFSRLGTYTGNYLKERWPWFPRDFDWSYFNAAPEDMQVHGYLKGDEKLYFENLHPAYSQYHSRLPGLRVRCFINELDDENEKHFKEVKMNLDTLWVDMEKEKLVLVWRGISEIKTEDNEEIQHIFIASEKLEEQPQTIEYYRAVLEKELAEPEEGFAEEEPLEVDEAENIEIEKELAKAEEQTRAALIDAGFDPDNPPQPSEEDKKKETGLLKELGFEEEKEEVPLTREIFVERADRKESFEGEDLRGIDLSGLNLQGINFQGTIMSGVSLANSDLSNSNLAEADLSEADLSGANLNNAVLKEGDLTCANLMTADLTGAVIEGAIFEKAKLNNAVLNGSKAKDAFFSGAVLTEASLIKGNFKGADFSKCILDKANYQGSNLSEASIEGASGIQTNMSETDLTGLKASEGCNFTKASFQKAKGLESIWEKANLTEADFSFSEMERANFSSASLNGANLYAANMKFAKFIKADLTDAVLVNMNLFQGSFEKSNLTKADCSGSNFYGVEFLNSIIADTKFLFTNVKMTKISK